MRARHARSTPQTWIHLGFTACVIAFGCASAGSDVGAGGASGAARATSTASAGGTTGAGGMAGAGSSAASGGASGATGAGGAGGGPYIAPVTCTTMTFYDGGDGDGMDPGWSCANCHVPHGAAPAHTFDVGGTVYATAHEADDCNGVDVSGVNVVITDESGTDHALPVNAVGNFYHDDALGSLSFAGPLMARVEYGGQVRKMLTPLTTGDCNSCHTPEGAENAPGRITLP